jgi:hypothetical protein
MDPLTMGGCNMRHIRSFLILALLVFPATSTAIELRWSTGATNLSFTIATRCTLIAEADSAELHLPGEWRLLWLANCQMQPLTVATPTEGPAEACDIHYPATLAEVASNIVTVGFCSAATGAPRSAMYVLDLPAGSAGKLKIIALDPDGPDSSAVIQSVEASFNGGLDGSYPMAVLRVTSDHSSNELRVNVVGSGLAAARSATVVTTTLPEVPLAITSQNDSSLAASAIIPAALPPASVLVAGVEGSIASLAIPADPLVQTELPDSAVYTDPDSTIYPKDFTLFYASTPIGGGIWQTRFHIFYIRACKTGQCAMPDSDQTWFGHAWSTNLVNWAWDIHAFHVSDNRGQWDAGMIWAPSIVLDGTRFYMFYTGVDTSGNQSIGFASTDNLDLPSHWSRQPEPVLTPFGSSWVKREQPWQFRDPFVMPDPASPLTRYLMFFTARDTTVFPDGPAPHTFNTVGVARSADYHISTWTHLGNYPSTNFSHTLVTDLESPHVFADAGHLSGSQANHAFWRIMYTDGNWSDWTRAILFTTKRADDIQTPLTDRDSTHWSNEPTPLYPYLHLTATSVEFGHQASEVMRFGNAWYWGGYDGTDLRFRSLIWEPDSINFHLQNVEVLDVGKAGPEVEPRFTLVQWARGAERAEFRVELPGTTRGSIRVYDVTGRRVRTLLDGQLSRGSSTVAWDGRDGHGARVGSGVYFVRLKVSRRSYVLRLPMLR